MKTKNEVIDYLRSEIEIGNGIIFLSEGQGGSGLNITSDENEVNLFIENLDNYIFEGIIKEEELYERYKEFSDSEMYQFIANPVEPNAHRYIVVIS